MSGSRTRIRATDVWLEDGKQDQSRPPTDWPLIPCSGGPAICPGRNLVLLLTSHRLGRLLMDRQIRLTDSDRLVSGHLPATLNDYSLRLQRQA
jgi:hypothetical protein